MGLGFMVQGVRKFEHKREAPGFIILGAARSCGEFGFGTLLACCFHSEAVMAYRACVYHV